MLEIASPLFVFFATKFVAVTVRHPEPIARPSTRRVSPPDRSPLVGGSGCPMVAFEVFFEDPCSAWRGLVFPATSLGISGTKDYIRFIPNSFATGTKYFLITGTATRPILTANAPTPPDASCRAGP